MVREETTSTWATEQRAPVMNIHVLLEKAKRIGAGTIEEVVSQGLYVETVLKSALLNS